jgi:hypothetical protein
MSTPSINNPFTPQTITIDVSGNSYQIADVSGNFYDMKNHIEFNVNMEVDPLYTLDSFVVDIDHAGATTRDYHFTYTLTNVPRIVNGYNVSKTISSSGTVCGDIEYAFINHQEYKIQYIAIFRAKTGSATSATLHKTSHIQSFTYYASPVTLVSDFLVSENVSNGDNIEVTGLVLDLSGNEIDETRPEYLTFSFQDYDNEIGDSNNLEEYDEPYIVRKPYNPSGNYTLTNNTLSNGESYEMLVTAQWSLGYNSSRISEQTIVVFNSPSIPDGGIIVLPLYLRNTNDDIITITISPTDEGEVDPSKLWFQIKTTGSSSSVVATAGGVNGIVYDPSTTSYSFELSDFVVDVSGVYLENDVSYNVVVKGEYNNIIADASGVSIPVYGYSAPISVTFDLTEPTISDIAVNYLCIIDLSGNILPSDTIATITVDHESYELFAPYAEDGIKFVFYDGATEVARTIAYDFENSASGSTEYDIKLIDVSGGYLENNVNYTVKAAVKVTDHSNNTYYRVASTGLDVTFDLTEPTISNIVVNSLYLVDPSGNILPSPNIATITVDHEAYELFAPYAEDGIKFVFYDGATEVARTIAYTFVNSASGTTSYDIKLIDVSGGYLENDVTYTVRAAVNVTDHSNNTYYRVSSESRDVTFDLTRPVIDNIVPYDVQNDGGQDGVFHPDSTDVDSASQIVATIYVDNAAYELYAPNQTNGILFIFYDSSDNEVARTSEYPFVNDSSSSSNLYNIHLDEISNTSLTNGTPYKVKAQVTLIDHSGNEEDRLSAEFYSNVIFTQNIAPVPYVEISNTWALVTNDDPESYTDNFANSPYIGISGNFGKNAQFGSLYYKLLDTTSTKFKLEYRVLVLDSSSNVLTDASGNAIDLSGNAIPWTPVNKAKLVLQDLSNNELLADAAERARAGTLSTFSSGEYANIPGTGLGTDQGDIVFFIPQQQVGTTDAFDETDKVQVKVSVVDRSSPALWGGLTTSMPTVSDPLQVILKIDEYSYEVGTASEPWNSVDASDNLLINIPVSWNSIHSYSVKVSYKYSTGDSYGAEVEFEKDDYPSTVFFVVDPTQGTTHTLYYRVRYVVTNSNLGEGATTAGIFTMEDVPNKFFPESSDYAILNADYATFNTDASSNITFDLSFNIDPANRLDGVNVYFTSTDSNIEKVRIGSYTTPGSITITLIDVTDASGVHLEIMDPSGNIVTSDFSWDKYDSASISFEAFRDARVESGLDSNPGASYFEVNSASDPEESGFYVESGSNDDFGNPDVNPIWNVPVLTTPSEDGDITLSGGVINSVYNTDPSNNDPTTDTSISWESDESYTDVHFAYELTLVKNDDYDNPTQFTVHSHTHTLPHVHIENLDIDTSTEAKYEVLITKVFSSSSEREVSVPTSIVFYSIYVDTPNMDITVRPVSNTTVVNLSWDELDISGNSVTDSGQEPSSFDNNIYAHYITYRTDPSDNLVRLDPSGNLIERIVSPETKKTYTLPIQDLGTLYEFFMYVEAQVKYTVNGGDVYSTKSTPVEVPTTLTTSLSQYRVSSVPSFGVVTTDPSDNDLNIVPVLIQGSSNPTLVMNLNANGLEDEGFISVVVILTQDGTDDKPEGEQVILVFPDPNPLDASSNIFPSFTQSVVGGAAGSSDPRLGGGDSATSVPRNIDYTVLSTDPSNNDYTLTIGTVGSDGRYGLSTLEMPPTVNSGFVSGSVVNYMVILTTRRGTDIGVGEFTYEAIPSVQNVEIVTIDGQYFVNFDISTA